jgi:RHS Repeat
MRILTCSLYLLIAAAAGLGAGAATAANGSVAYTYDALGRITTASYDTGVCIVYSTMPTARRKR